MAEGTMKSGLPDAADAPDYEPKPPAKRKESGFTAKDFLTITLSVLAFVVSGFGLYVNALMREDNISLVQTNGPPIAKIVDPSTLGISPQSNEVFFINTGNRPAAITNILIAYATLPTTPHGTECSTTQSQDFPDLDKFSAVFQSDVEPFVIKEKEIVRKSIGINKKRLGEESARLRRDGMIVFPVSDGVKNLPAFDIEICLIVSLTTPANYLATGLASLLRYPVKTRPDDAVENAIGFVVGAIFHFQENKTPILIHKHHGTIFEDF